MPRFQTHLHALALLLLASAQALADPPDVALYPSGAGLQVSPETLLLDRQVAHPGISLLTTSLGASGRGALGLDLRGASEGAAGFVQPRENRLASLRLAVYTDGAVGWHRLDNSCRGNSADRCSMVSVIFGIHGASASMQWREDGARALIARREFAQDAVHLRFQVNYRF